MKLSALMAEAQENLGGLMDAIGDSRLVLMGEATHGTEEFYRLRAELSMRLMVEKGFQALAVEGDWPDVVPINQYLRGEIDTPEAALSRFERFPAWMWRNTAMLSFLRTLKGLAQPVGVYGLDLYSLHRSMRAVVDYLESVDPEAAREAQQRYHCFEPYGGDPQAYGFVNALSLEPACEDAVVAQLQALQQADFDSLPEDQFVATQNARVVKNAERYYRTMFRYEVHSWNVRDQHMMETLEALQAFLGAEAKIIVWAHNSHVGDARYTEMGERGQWTLGQLARERSKHNGVFLLGLTTYGGSVLAAPEWDTPPQVAALLPAMPGSFENLFHQLGKERFWLNFQPGSMARSMLEGPLLERAVGVVYHPQSERQSHYFQAQLSRQFDALVHLDTTQALTPLPVHPVLRPSSG
jgi:erythromycin esterase-like protein